MQASTTNALGKTEKNKKVASGPCIFPFKYKRQTHTECMDTDKGRICATEVNPKTQTLKKYGYCPPGSKKMKTLKNTSTKQTSARPMVSSSTGKPKKRALKIITAPAPASASAPAPASSSRQEKYIKVLEELQDINARRGEPFRARAYQKAAESIMLHPTDIKSPDDIAHLPGIGETILAKLREYDETGTLRAIEKQKNDPLNE